MLEMVLYTTAAIGLYFLSDRILNAIERRRGERLPQRSLFFFLIIAFLAIGSFGLMRLILELGK